MTPLNTPQKIRNVTIFRPFQQASGSREKLLNLYSGFTQTLLLVQNSQLENPLPTKPPPVSPAFPDKEPVEKEWEEEEEQE